MVAQLLRLRLDFLAGLFRRRRLHIAGALLAGAVGIGFAVLAAMAIGSLATATPEIAWVFVVCAGSLLLLLAWVLPMTFGADHPLDPRRFSLFGIRSVPLAGGLALASLISLPSVLVIIVAAAPVVALGRTPASAMLAIVGTVIAVATCALLSRLASTFSATVLGSRRAQDVLSTVTLAVFVALAPVLTWLATAHVDSQVLPIARRFAVVLAWTPLGAVWSAPGDLALGRDDLAATRVVIAVTTLAVLALIWIVVVQRLTHHERPEREVAASLGLGWFDRLPATAVGVIAARSFTYWSRDARYRVGLAVIPLLPLVIVPLVVAGVPASIIAWVPVPAMCLFLGWSVHNDLAFDSSAFWSHLTANVSGAADRWGRLIPPLVVGTIVALAGSLVTVLVIARPEMWFPLTGFSMCVLLSGLGISSIASAAAPYPATQPGDRAFTQPQAPNADGPTLQSLSVAGVLLASAPSLAIIVLILLGVLDTGWYWVLFWGGLGLGLVVLLAGVAIGGRIVSKRGPELLAFTLQN